MFYPIGWHKVLRLDSDPKSKILSIIANSERELFLILTTTSIHLWNPRPSIEIACHRRSNESIAEIGANKNVAWKIDSSVFVIATDKDQLLFFKLHQRLSNPSWSSFMSSSNNPELTGLYKLKCELKNLKNTLGDTIYKELQRTKTTDCKYQLIPAISIVATGKLDLTSIGVSCLMAAEEELIVGGKDGDFYGIHWDGNVDDKFPWSIKDIPIRGVSNDNSAKSNVHIKDIKFSSVLSGFAIVFTNGRATFMSLKETMTGSESPPERSDQSGSQSPRSNTSSNYNSNNNNNNNNSNTNNNNKLIYLPGDNNAICVEINHRYRLIALGTEDSKIIVCNVGEPSTSIVLNHVLEFRQDKFPDIYTGLGPVKCMRYSPDSFALATSWESGHFALWSLFGSLLFCSEQWQLDSHPERPTLKAADICWGREGHSLWLSTKNMMIDKATNGITCSIDKDNEINKKNDDEIGHKTGNITETKGDCCKGTGTSLKEKMQNNNKSEYIVKEELVVLSVAHSTLSTSPHLTCSSDSIVLLSEDKIYIGPSIPHEAEFDNWHIVDIPYDYLASNYPIRYATVDRVCNELAIAGNNGFAVYNITANKWTMFSRKSQELGFTICGDMMWWNGYLIMSCYNIETENFEIRAYSSRHTRLDNDNLISQIVPFEVIRMSLFENRLLVLYSDGSFAMFMMNLRKKPKFNATNSARKFSTSNNAAPNPPSSSNDDNSSLSEIGRESTSSSRRDSNMQQEPASNHKPSQQNFAKLKRSDSIISNFSLRLQSATTNSDGPNDESLQISPMQNLIVSNLQANPYCISSIALTRLHFKNNRLDDSILLNYCGKLFLLERELPGKRSGVAFQAVSVIATNVEQFWISPEIATASEMSYFRKSLWLSCGRGNGSIVGNRNDDNRTNTNSNHSSSHSSNAQLQVWLPLLNDKADSPSDLYVPDRIMLPIRCDIYPLAIRSSSPNDIGSDDAIVLGAESDILYRDNGELFSEFPFCTVKRQCRVYLHRILRELLLNQHLGYYARKIAESCQTLPYFAHCFELLLHEVLEEEATSPIPLPDPMLPQVVEFIKKFPVYLETVVHCARKSELSMWSHLFADQAVGDPLDLFRECLKRGKLDTASSCLLILQSLDKMVSQKMLRDLMVAARLDHKFDYLIEDLEKFSIRAELEEHDPNDDRAKTTTPLLAITQTSAPITGDDVSSNNISNVENAFD